MTRTLSSRSKPTRGTGRRNALLLAPAMALLAVLFVYPLLSMLGASLFDPGFTLEHFVKFFTGSLYYRILGNTILVSLTATILCFLLGYPAAYFLARCDKRWRPILIFLVLLPMWVSALIRSYSWMAILGREGLINAMLVSAGTIAEPLPMLYTTGAVYLAMVQILLPIMILTCYGVMAEIEFDLVKAARIMGASPWRAFLLVYFPLSLSGARNGAIAIFILSMGFFITPALVGGRTDMMIGNLIDFQINKLAHWSFAAAIGIVLLIATIALVLLIRAAFDGMAALAVRGR